MVVIAMVATAMGGFWLEVHVVLLLCNKLMQENKHHVPSSALASSCRPDTHVHFHYSHQDDTVFSLAATIITVFPTIDLIQ